MEKKNIILIILDTLRADKFLKSNNGKSLTPFIKNLLNNSIYFKNCISNSPWTLPSHISMFTGLSPTQNTLLSKKVDRVSKKTPLLPEILSNLGYFTACFSENAFISRTYGLTRGFKEVKNVWDWNPWIRENYPFSKIFIFVNKIHNLLKQLKVPIFLRIWQHVKDRIENLIKNINRDLFLDKMLFKLKNRTKKDLESFFYDIKKKLKERNFLFFNFLAVHDPYIPLKRVIELFNLKFKNFKEIKRMIINPLKERLELNVTNKELSNSQIKAINKLYEACTFSADKIVKFLFSKLKEKNILKDSVVIITSDHGEHLGGREDHYFWEHNTYQSVYDPLMKVPLLIYNSDQDKQIITNQVQLKDLFHTILNFTDIFPSKIKYLDIKKSLYYQIKNESTPKYIFGEYLKSKKEMREIVKAYGSMSEKSKILKIFNHIYFLRSQNFKYIEYNNTNFREFYNIKKDPNESNNIFDMNNNICKEFLKQKEIYLKKLKDKNMLKKILTIKEQESVKSSIKKIEFNRI